MNPDPKFSTRPGRMRRLQKSPVDSIFIAALPRSCKSGDGAILVRDRRGYSDRSVADFFRIGVKGIFWDRRGFTLAELLIAAVFGLIVMASLYGFFRDQMFNLLSQETKTATRQDVRGALDIMVRELRNAGSWATGTAPTDCLRIQTATATSIRIQADLDGGEVSNCNSSTGEDVTYTLFPVTTTCSTIRRSASASSSGSALVGDCSSSNRVNVVPSGADVDGDGNGDLFTYYKAGSTTTFTPSSDPSSGDYFDNIKRVKITFAVQVPDPTPEGKAAGRTISSTLSSSVEFRNE